MSTFVYGYHVLLATYKLTTICIYGQHVHGIRAFSEQDLQYQIGYAVIRITGNVVLIRKSINCQ